MKFNRLVLAYALAFAPILNAYAATNSGIPINAVKFPMEVMETDVAAVVGGGADYGWIIGSPANLAASTTVLCLFDLGPDWKQYTKVQIAVFPVGPSSGFTNVQAFSRDDAVQANNNSRRLGFEYGTTTNGNTMVMAPTTAGLGVTAEIRPMGRFLVIGVGNADAVNAAGATSKVVVAAYPN